MLDLEDATDNEETEFSDYYHNGGEAPDHHAVSALQLAHQVIAKFPELAKRYQKFIGTAAIVSTALIVLTSIAIHRRMEKGESPAEILRDITSEEIENSGKSRPEKPKHKRGRLSH